MLINFRYILLIGLLVSFSIFSAPAKGNPPNARAKPLDFFGNNLSDWVTISGNGEGGKFTWNILKNDNPSPPGRGQATIALVSWGMDQLGMRAETGDWLPAFGDYTGDGTNDLIIYRGGDLSPRVKQQRKAETI